MKYHKNVKTKKAFQYKIVINKLLTLELTLQVTDVSLYKHQLST